MPLFFVLREGGDPENSRPLLVSGDRELLAEIVEMLARRLGVTMPPPRVTQLPSSKVRAEGDGPTTKPRGRD